MLRITTLENGPDLTFRLEGTLSGPWVKTLEQCWTSAQSERLHVELADVRYLDAAGRNLLTRMNQAGVHIRASGVLAWDVDLELLSLRPE